MTTEEQLAWADEIEHRVLGILAHMRAYIHCPPYEPDFTLMPEEKLWSMPHPNEARDRHWLAAGCAVGGAGILAFAIVLSLVQQP